MWFALWLMIALVVVKASYPASSYETPPRDSAERIGMLAAMVHEDLAFAAALGLIGQVALWSTKRRPRAQRVTFAGLLMVGAICIAFAVASVPMFHFLGTPLTYPLLHVAGNMTNMGSSLASFVRGGLIAALLLAPSAFIVLVLLFERRFQVASRKLISALIVLIAAGIVADFAWASHQRTRFWDERDDRGLTRSPHWTFVSSCVSEWAGGDAVNADASHAAAEFFDDFKTVRERGGARPTTLPSRPKNVILIVLESVSTQHLSLYGSPYDTTPRLRDEAKHSLIVRNCYSHVGMTANSLVSIMLGVYPPITWRQLTVENPNLPGESIPQTLAAHGYRTAYITSADNGYVNTKEFLASHGFDAVWDVNTMNAPYLFTWGCEDRHAFDATVKWIDAQRDEPFFVMLWTQQTHHPYPPREGAEVFDFFKGGPLPEDHYELGRYLNAIREADTQIGRLIDALRERKLADDTLIMITGDHGEGFGSPHDVYGHGSRVYEENLHVPMMLWNPRLFAGGRSSDAVGGLVDVGATICDVIGVPPAASWQGRSLLDPDHPPRTFFSAANDGYLLGVRQERWKYVFNATRGREELFDLSTDPTEQHNVAREYAELSRELRQRVGVWLASQRQRYAALQR